jgi:hypothetical protein
MLNRESQCNTSMKELGKLVVYFLLELGQYGP